MHPAQERYCLDQRCRRTTSYPLQVLCHTCPSILPCPSVRHCAFTLNYAGQTWLSTPWTLICSHHYGSSFCFPKCGCASSSVSVAEQLGKSLGRQVGLAHNVREGESIQGLDKVVLVAERQVHEGSTYLLGWRPGCSHSSTQNLFYFLIYFASFSLVVNFPFPLLGRHFKSWEEVFSTADFP